MRKFRIGDYYAVVEGAGLDSHRVGRVTRMVSFEQLKNLVPGTYNQDDVLNKVLLVDVNGDHFSMFKNYLVPATREEWEKGKLNWEELAIARSRQ